MHVYFALKQKPSILMVLSTLIAIMEATFVTATAHTIARRQDDALSWTIGQWITWRDQQISLILTPTLDAQDGTKILNRKVAYSQCLASYQTINQCLKRDPAFFTSDVARSAAMGNFIRFVTAQHWMALPATADGKAPNALGMEITDVEYSNYAAPYLVFPDLLKSQDFLTKMSSPTTYSDALKMILDHNESLAPEQQWIPLFYKAQFITTVDDAATYGRLLIMIPNEPFGSSETVDRWILFGIAAPDAASGPEMKSVSMFTVYRSNDDPNKTQTFFTDFMRSKDPQTGAISINSNFLLTKDPSHNCYYCHKPSIIPIHPAVEYDFDAAKKLIPRTTNVGVTPEYVNGLIMGYGKPDFIKQDTDAYGPCIGPVGRQRSDEFILSATKGLNLPVESYNKIREAMSCSQCNSHFAPINYPQALRTDLDSAAFVDKLGMLHAYIDRGIMPIRSNLSPIERQALWQCLLKEYYDPATGRGLLYEWLKGA